MRNSSFLMLALTTLLALATSLSAQEVAPKSFKSLDTNGDGWLMPDEFNGGGVDFRALDVNNDGAISLLEYGALINEWNTTKASYSLINLLASARSYVIRENAYPEDVAAMRARGLGDEANLDPWGNPYSFWVSETFPTNQSKAAKPSGDKPADAKGDAEGGAEKEAEKPVKAPFVPWAGLNSSRQGGEVLFYYSVRSAGIDGILGNEDDIYRNHQGAGMPTSEFQRRRAIFSDGEAYRIAINSWVHEQAFRLWLSVAEAEYSQEGKVTDLSTLTLAKAPFPDGKPTDFLGRPFKMVSVKGLRAIRVEAGAEEWQTELSLRESDFVSMLLDRVARSRSGSNYYYNVNNLFNYAAQFQQRNGRLPLSLSELRTTANNNVWAFRDNYGGSLLYLSINEGKNMLVINLGSDQKTGGVGAAMDLCYYNEIESADDNDKNKIRNRQWANAERARFTALEEVIKKASGSESEDNKPVSAAEIRRMIEQLDENADAEWRQLLNEKLAEAEAREAAEKEAPQADPSKPEPEEEEEADEDGLGNANEGIQMQAAPAPPVKPSTEGAKVADEAKAVEKPEGESAAATDAIGPPAVTDLRAMIPNRLYTDAEAQFLGIVIDQSWEFNQNYQRVLQLGQALARYYQSSTREDAKGVTMPFGNLSLANGEKFNASEEAANWRDNYSYNEDQIEHYIIARMVAPEKNQRQLETFCMGLVARNLEMPIFCCYTSRKVSTAKLYAVEKDQPAGWREAVVARDGKLEADSAEKAEGSAQPEKDQGTEEDEVVPER